MPHETGAVILYERGFPARKLRQKKMNKTLRAVCESAMFCAFALALSYLKIPIGVSFGGFGGSIDLVMVPLILCAVRWGLGWGLAAGLVFGTLKFFLAGGVAINWESMLLDYSVAYMAVGLAGLFRRKPALIGLAAAVGCAARFAVHWLSGITIYAEYMSDIFGLTMTNVSVYSLLYNGSYMLPNTVVALVCCLLLRKPLQKYLSN